MHLELTFRSNRTPFTFRDAGMQLSIVHLNDSIHAYDQAYAAIMPACLTANSSTAVFQADYWNPGAIPRFDYSQSLEFINKIAADRLANNTVYVNHVLYQLYWRLTHCTRTVPAHGAVGPLSDLFEAADFLYPPYSPLDYRFGKSTC